LEDPLQGDYQNLTGHFCDSPGAGFPSTHANREENTLTGVSYRRGLLCNVVDPYRVLNVAATPNYFPVGVAKGGTFGAGLFTLEADGADHYLDTNGDPVLTHRDGTPENFQVLASLDLRNASTASQAGVATMGFYTNVGTVFTAGTTEWASLLGDATIKAITENVLTDLYAERNRAAWTLSSARVYPPASWQLVATIADTISSITSTVQGQLLMQGASVMYARDAENPFNILNGPGDQSVAVSKLALAQCYGSDFLGKYLFGGTSDNKIHLREGGIYASSSWDAVGGFPLSGGTVPGSPVAIAGFNGDPFVMTRSAEVTSLYTDHSSVLLVVGREECGDRIGGRAKFGEAA
jgi:hypothetical protein